MCFGVPHASDRSSADRLALCRPGEVTSTSTWMHPASLCARVKRRDGLPCGGELGPGDAPAALDLRAEAQHNALLDDPLERKQALPGDEEPGGVATEIDDSDAHMIPI